MTEQSVNKVIDLVVDNFIEEISKKYNIDKTEIKSIWNSNNNQSILNASLESSVSSVSDTSSKTYCEAELSALLKPDLVSICKSKNLKCTGTKPELIRYILGNVSSIKKTQTKKSKVESESKEQKKLDTTIVKPVFKSIISQTPVIQIHRNQFGNFEHAETTFVFNNKTQKVIGKQNKNGDIDVLSKDDIDICNKYKFSYILPENLDLKSNADVHVDGIDEDEEEFEYEEDEEMVDEIIEEEEEFDYEEDE